MSALAFSYWYLLGLLEGCASACPVGHNHSEKLLSVIPWQLPWETEWDSYLAPACVSICFSVGTIPERHNLKKEVLGFGSWF